MVCPEPQLRMSSIKPGVSEAIVNADDETTVGEIRPLLTTDAVRFNRHKINRQLSRLDLASPVLEPEVIWLGRRR